RSRNLRVGHATTLTSADDLPILLYFLPMPLPRNVYPMRLLRRPTAFDHPDWIFEIKHDGFRALAHVEDGQCRLVSRNGNTFRTFPALCDWIGNRLRVVNPVLDGEIVCLNEDGRSCFNDLMFHRGDLYFYAFDLLWQDCEDLRE